MFRFHSMKAWFGQARGADVGPRATGTAPDAAFGLVRATGCMVLASLLAFAAPAQAERIKDLAQVAAFLAAARAAAL